MKLTSILPKEAIVPNLLAKEGPGVLRELSLALHRVDPNLNEVEIFSALQDRERLGSTGIGSGVAIPHGKLPNAKKILACFGRSVSGIDFQAQDGEPTFLFFALIAPENSAGLHLKVLAKLSRMLKEKSFRKALLEAKDTDHIFAILSQEDEVVPL